VNRTKSATIKKTISLSSLVAKWGQEMALKKGFDANFSAYVADLIRQDRNKDLLASPNAVSPTINGNNNHRAK
jgi:hypothetical protein